MLDPKTGSRELAYVVTIDEIVPIAGYDRVEYARVGGWWVVVKKDEFKVGDKCVYIEIDSKVPATEPFAFMEKCKYRVKSAKMCKVISQGLIVSLSALSLGDLPVGEFVTEKLGITYYDPADVERKSDTPREKKDKYQKMMNRNPKLAKNKFTKWLFKFGIGKRILFMFFGTANDKKNADWPYWVKKTDEERCQNLPHLFITPPVATWYATEKIDGTSSTYTMKRAKKKNEFYICSRNRVIDTNTETAANNIYIEMAEKYHIKDVLTKMLENAPTLDFVTLQGESYGGGVQKRDYSMKNHDFVAFNLIFGYPDGTITRLNPVDMKKVLDEYHIPCVPIINTAFTLPATCDELLQIAEGNSVIDGKPREGLVFRSKDGVHSFKAVSNSFLLKFHG